MAKGNQVYWETTADNPVFGGVGDCGHHSVSARACGKNHQLGSCNFQILINIVVHQVKQCQVDRLQNIRLYRRAQLTWQQVCLCPVPMLSLLIAHVPSTTRHSHLPVNKGGEVVDLAFEIGQIFLYVVFGEGVEG